MSKHKTPILKKELSALLSKMLHIAYSQRALLENGDAEGFLNALMQREALVAQFEALKAQTPDDEAPENAAMLLELEENIKQSAAALKQLDEESLKLGEALFEEYKDKLKEFVSAKKQHTYAAEYTPADGLFFDSTN